MRQEVCFLLHDGESLRVACDVSPLLGCFDKGSKTLLISFIDFECVETILLLFK